MNDILDLRDLSQEFSDLHNEVITCDTCDGNGFTGEDEDACIVCEGQGEYVPTDKSVLDEFERYVELRDLAVEVTGCNEDDPQLDTAFDNAAENEPTMIHENEFEDYAQQLAKDIGAINDDTQSNWPLDCIDWEKAAEQLQQDYTEINWCGETYYMRSA